jgi:predicted nucleic acid-binding protein
MDAVSGAFSGVVMSSPPVWETHGVRLVVRDLGNGVVRLECFELVTADDAVAMAKLTGSSELAFPVPERFRDLVREAAERIGLVPSDCHLAAFARGVDDAVIEIVATYCC